GYTFYMVNPNKYISYVSFLILKYGEGKWMFML
ncbi:unnamed protein product, partial [marine sediment metagenome]